eukprot:TRINITY_DN1110_c5_g1_i1.p1 TRINITY_DN1110_c5_g1~~TRINITY_DN1110_c5_g1_i1.p1  ORF type:complete len:153 (-),score=23.82 TRINITY_DN1110_c5_g1_i1:168-626(-)
MWAPIAVMMIYSFTKRKSWSDEKSDRNLFVLIIYITAFILLAYGCWVADKFFCENVYIAYIPFHGLWHLFIVHGFLYLIVFTSYVFEQQMEYLRYEAMFKAYPNEHFILLCWVYWKFLDNDTIVKELSDNSNTNINDESSKSSTESILSSED